MRNYSHRCEELERNVKPCSAAPSISFSPLCQTSPARLGNGGRAAADPRCPYEWRVDNPRRGNVARGVHGGHPQGSQAYTSLLHLSPLSYQIDFGFDLIWFCFVFGSDPTVRFLREQMEKEGCPVWPKLFSAVNCTDNKTAGGYMSGRGVCSISLPLYYIIWKHIILFHQIGSNVL